MLGTIHLPNTNQQKKQEQVGDANPSLVQTGQSQNQIDSDDSIGYQGPSLHRQYPGYRTLSIQDRSLLDAKTRDDPVQYWGEVGVAKNPGPTKKKTVKNSKTKRTSSVSSRGSTASAPTKRNGVMFAPRATVPTRPPVLRRPTEEQMEALLSHASQRSCGVDEHIKFVMDPTAAKCVPKPLCSSGRMSRPYLPVKGSIRSTMTIPNGVTFVFIVNPNSSKPVWWEGHTAATSALGTRGDPVTAQAAFDFPQGPTTGQTWLTGTGDGAEMNYIEWFGGQDPRRLVTNLEGSDGLDWDISAVPDLLCHQFMGGKITAEIKVPYQGLANITVVDAGSTPEAYGPGAPVFVPVPPTPNGVQELDGAGFKQYYSSLVGDAVYDDIANTGKNISIVGGSAGSVAHIGGFLPAHQGWVPTTGNYVASAVGNANIYGVPSWNNVANVAAGYGFFIIQNSGGTPVTVTLSGDFFYNQQTYRTKNFYNPGNNSPTTLSLVINPAAMTSLSMRVTEPYYAPVAQISSVLSLCTDQKESRKCAAAGSQTLIKSMTGFDLKVPIMSEPTPTSASVVKGADSTLLNDVIGALKDVGSSVLKEAGPILLSAAKKGIPALLSKLL